MSGEHLQTDIYDTETQLNQTINTNQAHPSTENPIFIVNDNIFLTQYVIRNLINCVYHFQLHQNRPNIPVPRVI